MVPFLHIVDDFLDDPMVMREMALRLNYSVSGAYPGRNSVEKIAMPGIEAYASRLVGEPVEAMPPPGSHNHCRLSVASDPVEAAVHVDPSHWTGILYLSLPEHCRGGTDFYIHKRTGTDRVPRTADELAATGYATYDEFKQDVMDRDELDRSAWELTTSIGMRFNRLALIQPQYWHTSGAGFGSTAQDGRLVYLLFFRRRNAG